MPVFLIDHMGTDLTVVNSARVSFAKSSDWISKNKLKSSDISLIQYLAKHGHWTPFSHCTVTFRIKAPIFVARQLFKHKVGLTENEISRRYVDTEPEFYVPGAWRGRPNNKKQGSSGVIPSNPKLMSKLKKNYAAIKDLYFKLLEQGIAPEQARMILPQAMYTEWYWTGSMVAFARVCNLRMSEDAQQESGDIADEISRKCNSLWPVSWMALTSSKQVFLEHGI
jgi:thymidylate synthase (FAD)